MINWPTDLVQDLARRKAVLVLGAGVSKNSIGQNDERPKDWSSFLENATTKLSCSKGDKKAIRNLIASGDFLTACDVIRDQLGVNAFGDLVRDEFKNPKFAPADIHKSIEKIDSRYVITPNFDKIYETYVATQQGGSVIVKSYSDTGLSESMRIPNRVILKIHGTVDTPGEMIFTRGDYARARSDFRACYEIVAALVLTHTFLFIGCGLSDPDAALILENYVFAHPGGRHHYFITGATGMPKTVQSVFERTRGIKFIKYDAAGGHAQLTDGIAALAALVQEARIELSRTQNW